MDKYFESSYLKIQRANHHIKELEESWVRFSKNHNNLFSKGKGKGRKKITQHVPVKIIPSDFSLIIGDAIHNLRTALDHLVFSIVCIKDENSLAHFPTGANSKKFKASLSKNLKLCPKYLCPLFEKIQAFEGGAGENIRNLHSLDIDDKHHQLILQDQSLVIPYGLDEAIMSSGKFEYFTHTERFLMPGKVIVLIEDKKPISFNLSFRDPPFRLQKVFSTLSKLSKEVEGIVDKFEPRIRRKK